MTTTEHEHGEETTEQDWRSERERKGWCRCGRREDEPAPLCEWHKARAERTAPDLSADEKAEVARFGIHDVPESLESPWEPSMAPIELDESAVATMAVEAFIVDQNITRGDLAELLREYRSETGMSPFEWGERDTLDDQFLNWHRWERLA